MKQLNKSMKIAFTSEERISLSAAFERFLDKMEQVGGKSVELEALFVILNFAEEDSLIRSIQQQVQELLEKMIPHELTLSQAEDLYGIKAATLRRACFDSRLRGRKCGKTWVICAEDLEKFLGSESG